MYDSYVHVIMTLYSWIHWFWITFYLSTRWVLISSYPFGATENLKTVHFYPNSDKNHSDFVNSTSIGPTVHNYVVNLTEKIHNKTELQSFNNKKISKGVLPKNQSHVIDSNLFNNNNWVDNITSSNISQVDKSSNNCSEYDNETVTQNSGNQQSLLTSSNYTMIELQNVTSSSSLSAAGITGISLGCLAFMTAVTVIAFIAYRNFGFNRPQVLNDHCSNPDSSGYIDDSTMRENSEEMYSLDNDSFLNSLEAMTIQNLWTDTVKHTKL